MYGHPKIVDMFLLRVARTDIVNMGGDSLLHMAAQYGKYDILMKVRKIGVLVFLLELGVGQVPKAKGGY